MLDVTCRGISLGFLLGLLILSAMHGCTDQQWASAIGKVQDVKGIMSGTCVRGESWEACIEKCEHAAKTEPQGGGGQGGQ